MIIRHLNNAYNKFLTKYSVNFKLSKEENKRMNEPKDPQQEMFQLPTPSDFHFPFQPYDVQLEFMQKLYSSIEKSQVSIFESPTGTGKSLSLICGAFKWLKDNASRHEIQNNDNPSGDPTSKEPSWVLKSHREKIREQEQIKKQELAVRLNRIRERENVEKKLIARKNAVVRKKIKTTHNSKQDANYNKDAEAGFEEFTLDDYNSDDQESFNSSRIKTDSFGDNYSAEVKELLSRFRENQEPDNYETLFNTKTFLDEEEEEPDETKIFYCSRTHSQLTQFVNELRKTSYASDLKAVSLGSRKHLCINEDVKKLKNPARMNEQCLEMQKPRTKPEKKCPYLPITEKARMLNFKDHVLAVVRDIEDLVSLGQKLDACPYYGTRKSIRQSQIVILPYNLLLLKSTRDSLGISLKNNIVIIDEAHNLMDTITAINTVLLDLPQVIRAQSQVSKYLERYKRRLTGKNIIYIRLILSILDTLSRFLNGLARSCEEKKFQKDCYQEVKMANDFIHELKIDNMNIFKIQKYLKRSHLARKLNGFIDKVESQGVKIHDENLAENYNTSSLPSLNQVEAFLMSLTNGDADGRVILGFSQIADTTQYKPFIKYLLLNPANHFKDIVSEARSVILAGGTMEPIRDFIDQLLPYLAVERIQQFSFRHVIPPRNLLTLTLSEGPAGIPMNFTYERRGDEKLIDQLGQVVTNLCNVIPDGVVCFFGSYSYLEKVYSRWQKNGILARIQKRKKIFCEPRHAEETEKFLCDYALHIESISTGSNGGALLLSVVGGKMSEGINFSDRLGRGVVMVGLPYANMNSPQLKEKMKYIDQMPRSRGCNGHSTGKDYYENLCMRAVNQSIGRAIRHKNDYAIIVLVDGRFNTPRTRQKLPGWIKDSVVECSSFGKLIAKTGEFFRNWK
ncbi:hypothetical protein G9A89_011722 [Geosiphon pyriformis]|nr:hypothetical protein G9A89_011722 [Geosiphon pyriformis]